MKIILVAAARPNFMKIATANADRPEGPSLQIASSLRSSQRQVKKGPLNDISLLCHCGRSEAISEHYTFNSRSL